MKKTTARKTLKGAALIATVALFAAVIPSGASWAAPSNAGDTNGATLTLHYYKAGGGYQGAETAVSFTGESGTQTGATRDGNWLTTTFNFPSAAQDAYLGFIISGDSAYPGQKRFVRAKDGAAEAWLVDGDPQVYAAPEKVDSSLIVTKDLKAYVAVEDLTGLLGLTYQYGTNGYVFDGAATHTVPILTIYRGRDYFEINVDSNRIGQNVTGNMLRNYTDTVFTDVDGFKQNGKYYLSFGYIQRLFQVGTLVTDRDADILPRQFVSYNTVQPVGNVADVGFSQAGLDAVDSYAKDQVSAGFPSVAFSIVKDGKLVKESAFGYAKKYDTPLVDGIYQPAQLLPQDQWEPATVDTMYDLASNTKMYATNYAIQQLVSEGKLDLNRTLQSFPGWENFTDSSTEYTGDWTVGGPGGITKVYSGKSTVTVADLLHHMAGEIPDPQYPNLNVAGGLYYQSSNIHDRSGIINVICKTPLIASPRTEYLYSDVDFMILGILVEQLTGQTLDQYMHDHFYGPLGLTHTTFNPLLNGFTKDQTAATELNGNTRDGNVSFGTFPDGTAVPMRHYTLQGQVQDEKAYYSMGGVSGHAGLFSNVGDMAVLTQLMLNGGLYNGRQYFTQEVAKQFTTPYALNPANDNTSTIGLGWRVHSKSSAAYYYFNWGPSRSSYGHQGWTGTLTIIDPTYDMTITILTNIPHSPVVDPPNGFEADTFGLANLVPVSARIYNALLTSGTQYSPIASIAPVTPVSVINGTSAAQASAALPKSTTITDAAGVAHPVALNWTLSGAYDASKAGSYDATASFALPANVVQSDPATQLTVESSVVVEGPPTASLPSGTVDAGSAITVTGSGFGPGESVAVLLTAHVNPQIGTPIELGSLTTDAAGAVTGAVTIPAGTKPGNHLVEFVGQTSGLTALTGTLRVHPASGPGST